MIKYRLIALHIDFEYSLILIKSRERNYDLKKLIEFS